MECLNVKTKINVLTAIAANPLFVTSSTEQNLNKKNVLSSSDATVVHHYVLMQLWFTILCLLTGDTGGKYWAVCLLYSGN